MEERIEAGVLPVEHNPGAIIEAVVAGQVWLPPSNRDLTRTVLAALTVPSPKYAALVRMGKPTYRVDRTLCFVQQRNQLLGLPRGAARWLASAAKAHGSDIVYRDQRHCPLAAALDPIAMPDLRDYQAAAVDRAVAGTQGLLVLPTGAGKSRTAMGIIAKLRTRTLVLVAARDLAQQWRESIEETLGVRAGLVGDGAREVGDITIALVQALARWSPAERAALLDNVGCLIVDEAHRSLGDQLWHLISACPARYRFGLTATPERADGLGAVLKELFGPVLYRASTGELSQKGVLVLPQLRWLETAFEFTCTSHDDYAALQEALVTDADRNRLIVERIAAAASDGHISLVLSGRKDHCHALVQALAARDIKAELLTSDVPRKERARRLAAARAGELPVLVATSLADEGLDLPIVSRVFLTFPSRARGRLLQRIGRAMRPHPDKRDAVVIDVVDRKVPVLLRQAHARSRGFASAFEGCRS